ncbi:ATP-binding protein [Clostridium sp. WILCCON 0269]|uniref:histidine kinase n=1 Tax=Candidatus Clostridium eludens TaxID=3381663 RepID=A0ABW8SIS9_9CLOT
MLKIYLTSEYDWILARQKAQQIAKLLGYDIHDQVRIATAVSESIRISLNPLGEGEIIFFWNNVSHDSMFMVEVKSYKIVNLNENKDLMEDKYYKRSIESSINSVILLMDKFYIKNTAGEGKIILLGKLLPKSSLPMTEEKFYNTVQKVNGNEPQNNLDYMRQQNQEILNTLVELKKKQEEVNTLNKELQETNKGVIALFNELEEKAEFLKQSNEIKNTALLNVSHEFKTPIHAILGMVGLLSGKIDGELSTEQEKQVLFIKNSANELLDMVNNILDMSKIEAGKINVEPAYIELEEIFCALKGMFKPLNIKDNVSLVFELTENIPTLYTDNRKLSQIISNFISNALKFTQEGEINVSARLSENKDKITILVRDTGIGISEEEQKFIFEEFTQMDNYIQRNVKGTGLGLPLSMKLSKMLKGSISIQSKPGVGSIFSVTIPIIYDEIDNSD